MSVSRYLAVALLVPLAFGLSACSRDGESAAADVAPVIGDTAQTLVVHEGPHCGCCGVWREHMEAAGFQVDLRKTHELGAVKADAGVPRRLASCHTAQIGGYYVEGHVPADDIRRLLAESPKAIGLATPGMPQGSPGMETSTPQPYETLLVGLDGSARVFARH